MAQRIKGRLGNMPSLDRSVISPDIALAKGRGSLNWKIGDEALPDLIAQAREEWGKDQPVGDEQKGIAAWEIATVQAGIEFALKQRRAQEAQNQGKIEQLHDQEVKRALELAEKIEKML